MMTKKTEWIEKFDETAATLEQSIKDYIKWMALNGYAQSTQKSYKYVLDQFLSFIKHRRYVWDEIFAQDTFSRFKNTKALSEASAVIGLSRYLFEKGSITEPIRVQKTSPLLPAIYEDYLLYQQKYHHASDRIIRSCKRVLRPFDNYLKMHCIKLRALKIEHIDRFRTEHFKDFSDGTRRIYRGLLRSFLKYLFHERRVLTRDLAPLVTGAPIFAQAKPPKFLRPDEVKRLFAVLKFSTARELRAAAIVHLAYMLGLRPCEISSLTLDDIFFEKQKIHLRHRKNDRPCILPIPEPAIKAIAAYLVGGRVKSEHRFLFLSLRPPYRPLSPWAAGQCIGKCMKTAEVPGEAYWLRHTYAQNLLQAGLSIYEVKEMLGHINIESTRRYLHIHIKLMREVLFDDGI